MSINQHVNIKRIRDNNPTGKSHFSSVSFRIRIIIFVLLLAFPIYSQETRELARDQPKLSDKRTALVIGNANYTVARKLVNPVNDATDMSEILIDLGFEVISGTDLTLKQMREKIREFGDKLRANGGVGLFYYAGHGVQVNNNNYLIPVDADIPREDEIDDLAYNLDGIFGKMATAHNGLNIVILDACRNNPFARSWNRGDGTGGLAQVNAPAGSYIAYATSPGTTANDGSGRNGLYTGELLKSIRKANLTIEETFKDVRKAVDAASRGKQIPWDSSSVRGDFYFKKESREQRAWDYVKYSVNPQNLRDFLREFPAGANADIAKLRLEEVLWESIRDSKDQAKIKAYLSEFPSGSNAFLANLILRNLVAPSENVSLGSEADDRQIMAHIDFFYYQLGNNPTAMGYIINNGTPGEIKKRKDQIENALASRVYDKSRVTIIDGTDNGKGALTKFIIVPAGSTPSKDH